MSVQIEQRLRHITDPTPCNPFGTITAQEVATAHTTSWLAEALSHLVVKYESEWGGSMDRWVALTRS